MTCATMTELKLADGTPYEPGMTLFLPVDGIDGDGPIQRLETAGLELVTFVDDGWLYNCLAGNDVSFYYPSRESILDARIERLESSIRAQQAALEHCRAERKCGS
jgi:hypothetical protein